MSKGRRTAAFRGVDGFTLLEMLIALLLLTLVVGSLSSITAEWLPNWKRVLIRTRTSEKVANALDRLVNDLSAAQYVSLSRQGRIPLFQGDEKSVTFVRSAIGPNGARGPEIVRIVEISDVHGPALVRMRAQFRPLPDADLSLERIAFSDPVVLLRPPFHIVFGYARSDGQWMKLWNNATALPTAVRFMVRNDDGTTPISTATRIQVDIMTPPPEQVNDTTAVTDNTARTGTGATQ